MKQEADKSRVVLNLRTSSAVKVALKKEAERQERSLNWVLDRAVRRGLGLQEAA